MKIHHLNCATCCPVGGHFMDGISPGVSSARLVCHTLLIESNSGLVLVDTGMGLQDVHNTRKRINGIFRNILRPLLQEHETAHYQIKQLGFDPSDVRHIVLTHLDFDHAGGIDDFPEATVHVMQAEQEAAVKRKGFVAKGRYSPAQLHDSKYWNKYNAQGEQWYGFDCVRELEGLPPEILLVPLVGHTEGHAGVAVETNDGWLLHAGDAYFYRGEMDEEYHCTPGLSAYQKLMEVNREMRLKNQQRLRYLAQTFKEEITIFSAHDAMEYLALKESGHRYIPANPLNALKSASSQRSIQ